MSEPADDAPRRDDVPADVAARMKDLRDRIDALDVQIVELLNERAGHALAIGRLKDDVGLDTYQPSREIDVLAHARRVNGGPLDGDAITRLFERIIDENRRLERSAEGRDGGTSGAR